MTAPRWDTAGCYAVADGVHRIPLPMPGDGLRAINVYALDTPDGLALIDGGWNVPGALEQLQAALSSIGRGVNEIHDVFVTHIHRDHYTLAVEMRRRFGTRVHLGESEAPGLAAVRQLGSNVPVDSLRELHRAGAPQLAAVAAELTRAEPFDASGWAPPDQWIEPGEIRIGSRRLLAIATPGHTKGHLVFHDEEAGLLFAGDHVLPTITPSIGFELGDWDLPLVRFLDSLTMLLERPDARLLPAHGAPGDSVHTRIRELLQHHTGRFSTIMSVVASMPGATAYQVAQRLEWTRRDVALDRLDGFNQMIAVCETLAHLDALIESGRLSVRRRRGVERFEVCSPGAESQRSVDPASRWFSAIPDRAAMARR